MKYELEKYRGNKSRHTCPNCRFKHCFARYVNENGDYLSDEIGRCNRESKCGHHRKPKDFFSDNPQMQPEKIRKRRNAGKSSPAQIYSEPKSNKPDYLERDLLLKTLTNYEQNAFVKFLINLFPDDSEIIEKTIKDYLIGTTRDGKTVFWQVDEHQHIRTGKIIAYDAQSGKRRKDIFPDWVHSKLKKSGRISEDFNLRQCFFGEHLLNVNRNAPVAIVEAEKTAVLASICFSEFIWIACGAKQNINALKLQRLGRRQIVLYPDADGFTLWQEIAAAARLYGATVKVSNLLEKNASNEEKRAGYDLADYIINEQCRINQHNNFADNYNFQIEKILNDENLFCEFNRDLDAQKAKLILYGGMPKTQAESRIAAVDNIRETVFRIFK